MPPYIIFRISCIAFFIGVGFFSFSPPFVPIFGLYVALLILGALLVFLWHFHRARVALIVIASFIFGFFRFGIAASGADDATQWLSEQKNVRFQGVVMSDPYTYGKRQVFSVETTSPRTARFSVWAPSFPRMFFGDTVSFQCATIQYKKMKTMCSAQEIELMPQVHAFNTARIFGSIKSRYLESIEQWLPFPHAQLLSSILIGVRSGLPRDLSQTFSTVGLSHIIAISGYNITILLAFLAPLVRRNALLSAIRLPILLGGIFLFTLFTGASAATVRAAIMGCAVLIATALARRSLGFQLLLGAAFFMVLADPAILLYDRGFQLSFAATFGLLSLAPMLTQLLGKMSTFHGFRDIAIQTVSASLATVPFIVVYFGKFSLISFVTNLLVVPLIPILMALGFLWSALAIIVSFTPFALFSFVDQTVQFAAFPVWALLDYIITVSEFFSFIPFPALTSASPVIASIIIASAYAVCIFLFLKVRKSRHVQTSDYIFRRT